MKSVECDCNKNKHIICLFCDFIKENDSSCERFSDNYFRNHQKVSTVVKYSKKYLVPTDDIEEIAEMFRKILKIL